MEITQGHWVWCLHSILLCPPIPWFLFSKHKTKQSYNLAIDQEVWHQLFSAWQCGRKGRNAWQRISTETQLSLPGSWQISYWHSAHIIRATSVGCWLTLKKKKCSIKERWIHGNIANVEALRRISRAVPKEGTKLSGVLAVCQSLGENDCFSVTPFSHVDELGLLCSKGVTAVWKSLSRLWNENVLWYLFTKSTMYSEQFRSMVCYPLTIKDPFFHDLPRISLEYFENFYVANDWS